MLVVFVVTVTACWGDARRRFRRRHSLAHEACLGSRVNGSRSIRVRRMIWSKCSRGRNTSGQKNDGN